jgi:hypothetical protein
MEEKGKKSDLQVVLCGGGHPRMAQFCIVACCHHSIVGCLSTASILFIEVSVLFMALMAMSILFWGSLMASMMAGANQSSAVSMLI